MDLRKSRVKDTLSLVYSAKYSIGFKSDHGVYIMQEPGQKRHKPQDELLLAENADHPAIEQWLMLVKLQSEAKFMSYSPRYSRVISLL